MKALRFVLVAAAAALASLLLAVPASATDNTGKIVVAKPVLTLPQCPKDGSIKLVKTADKTDYNVNDIVTFTLKAQAVVCSAGLVTVHDSLPAGLIGSDPTVLNHNFGSIAAGSEKSFSFQAVAVAKGTLTNKVHATGFSVGLDDPGELCQFVRQPSSPLPPQSSESRIIRTPYYCPKSSDAEVTINVTAPTGGNPTPPPPPPSQPPSNPGTPSLPNTGRQG